jgi:hypothetical protein
MHIIHEYGVSCEYTVQYVLYTVDVCIIYSVGHSLADCQASKAYEPIRLTRTLHSWQRPANCRLLRSVGLERVGLPCRYSAFAAWFFHTLSSFYKNLALICAAVTEHQLCKSQGCAASCIARCEPRSRTPRGCDVLPGI